MFKLLKTVFKAGDVTTKYPFKPYEVDEDFRGKPELNSDQCIVCAACTIACPANALTMRTDPVTGLSQDFELSVTNKQDLFQETTFATVTCQECGKPFISYKELNYTIDLFKQTLDKPELVKQKLAELHTCPVCKRQHSLEKTANMESNMRMKLIDFKEPVRLNFKKALEQREQSAVDLPNVLAGGERR